MSAFINISIKGKNGEYQDWTVQISDTTSEYGSNVRMYPKQTKEEIAQKVKPKQVFYGSVFWTDGKISVAEKPKPNEPTVSNLPDDPAFDKIIEMEDDSPF